MLILSVIVGILVGLGAVIIKNLVHLIQSYLENLTILEYNFLYLIYPAIGVLLVVVFIKYINKRPVRHGIPSVLYAISRQRGVMHQHNLYSSIVTSALTVGFGGSVGLEGPSVATGAAIGSNLGRVLHLNYKQVILLLGCASAEAMSAIFKAPIAAVVFALEIIMLDLTVVAIVPLLISSATAALTSYLFLGQNYLYSFQIEQPFLMAHLPYFLLLGILTGFVSLYFIRIYKFITKIFDSLDNPYKKWILGVSVLGILIFIFPSLYGEGYETINQALRGNYGYLFNNTLYEGFRDNLYITYMLFMLILLFKVVAASVTFGSGGIGGMFAPTLFVGANTGLFFVNLLNHTGLDLPQSNFALVGMAGLIAGVLQAPLTAIFLIAEISGGYQLFMPLMIVATISFATIRIFESSSVYTYQLAKRGELMTHHKDRAVLMMMKVEDLIETDFKTVHPEDTLGNLVEVITHAHRNIFPVVDDDNTFRGIVKMDDIRNIMFNHELYENTYVRDLMFMPQNVIDPEDPMEEVARKFQVSGRFNIAVISKGKYLGFISRARLFSAYRKMLRDFSED